MKFEQFWSKLYSLDETTLQTLTQKKEFKSTFDKRYDVVEIIPSSTSLPRTITRDQFHKVWIVSKDVTKPFKTSHYGKITRNSSYIIAIMKYLLNGEKSE